jgi:two-component system response regulator FixJ
MTQPTIHVVDDQEAVRHALAEMLSVLGYSVETHATADAFLASLRLPLVGCVITDVRMPGMDGVELVRELARRNIPAPVIVISGHADVPMAVAAIKAGAEDFIEKPVDDAQLVAAINRCLARTIQQLSSEQSFDELRRRLERLTPRELEVMDLVVQGYTSAAIAEKLRISARTVESYRVQIMDKMQAPSVAVLVRQSIRIGRLDP